MLFLLFIVLFLFLIVLFLLLIVLFLLLIVLFVCTVLMPPGVIPIAVNKYIIKTGRSPKVPVHVIILTPAPY